MAMRDRSTTPKRLKMGVLAATTLIAITAGQPAALADYWDANGAIPGSGNVGGNWSDAKWTWDANGAAATWNWTDGGDVVFSAGADSTGSLLINVGNTKNVRNITVEEGQVTLGSGGDFLIADSGGAQWRTYSGAGLTVTQNTAISTAGSVLWFRADGSTGISGSISGPGGIGTSGTGVLTLSGNNSYTGPTYITAGTLALGSAGALGTISTIRFGWGSMTNTTGVLQFSAANTTDYSTRFSAVGDQAFKLDTNGQNVTLAHGIGNNYSCSLYKLGAGSLTLSASNMLYGGTTLEAGTLVLAHTDALKGSHLHTNGAGTLVFDSSVPADVSLGRIFSIGAISGFTNIVLQDNGATPTRVHLSIGSSTYAGAFSGPGSVSLIGNSIFTAASTHTGTTYITQGTLTLANQNALQNSTVSVYSGSVQGTVAFDSSVAAHAFTFGGVTGSGNIALNDNAPSANAIALTVGKNNESTQFSGTLSGPGSLTKIGSGTLTLRSSNTYTGATSVTAGTLALRRTNALSSSTAVSISGSGTLDIGSYDQHVGSFSISGGWLNGTATLYANSYNITGGVINAHLGNSGSTANYTGGSNTISGTTDSGAVNVSGPGTTVVLGSTATFTSPTATFNVSSGAALDTSQVSGGFTVSGGQRLVNNGQVSGAVTAESGGSLKGSGTMTDAVTIGNAGSFSPGNSPGTMNFASGLSFLSGGTYVWEVNQVTSLGGDQSSLKGVDPGFDFANITGALDITGPFTVDITGLDLTNNPGSVSQWSAAKSYSWIVATASGGISGANNLSLVTTHFADNNATADGANNGFSITALGNDLVLTYSPVPEPSTIAMLAGGAVMGLAGALRRHKSPNTPSKG